MYPMKRRFLTVCLVFIGLTSLAPDGRADEAAAAQVVVENANRTFTHFIMDPDMVWFRNNLDRARAADRAEARPGRVHYRWLRWPRIAARPGQ